MNRKIMNIAVLILLVAVVIIGIVLIQSAPNNTAGIRDVLNTMPK